MTIFNVKDFGAAGNGIQDDATAFQEALNAMTLLNSETGTTPKPGATLLIPYGQYRLGKPLRISQGLVVQGDGGWTGATTLIFYQNPELGLSTPLAGIIVDRELNNPNDQAAGYKSFATGTVIRDITVRTDNAFYPPDHCPDQILDEDENSLPLGTASGIVLYAKARIENCLISGFQDDGIHINTSAGSGRNANTWHIDNCWVMQNGRHGLFVSGGNANVGSAINLLCQSNCRWGIYDRSFLGNTYIGCTAESNGYLRKDSDENSITSYGGGYRTTNPNARHVFLNCYSEGDQAKSIFSYPSLIIGGLFSTGLVHDSASARFPVIIRNEGNIEIDELRVHETIATDITKIASIASGGPQEINEKWGVIFASANGLRLDLHLPSASSTHMIGRQYTIKKIDPNPEPVIIKPTPSTSEKIDGTAEVSLNTQYSWIVLISDGNNWNIIGRG